MSHLFVMCGAPGCGKSFYIEKTASKDAVVVSRDAIRYSMINDEDAYFSKENQVFKEYIRQIQEALDAGKVVYADATHLNYASRNKLLSNLNLEDTAVTPIYFETSLKTCLERNAARTGRARVPDDVVRRMYCSMTDPGYDEGPNYGVVVHVKENSERK